MDHTGLDLGKTSSRLCAITADGELIERRIKTDRESLDGSASGIASELLFSSGSSITLRESYS